MVWSVMSAPRRLSTAVVSTQQVLTLTYEFYAPWLDPNPFDHPQQREWLNGLGLIFDQEADFCVIFHLLRHSALDLADGVFQCSFP